MTRYYGQLTHPGTPITPLLVAPQGGWTWFSDPRAVHYNGKTYWTYIDSSGLAKIDAYTSSGGLIGTPFQLHDSHPSGKASDDHNNPTMLLRNSDHKLVAFYCGHVATPMYVRISTNAEDHTAWGSEVDISASIGGGLYTYPNPVQLSAESNKLYLFYRRHATSSSVPDWYYTTSTDGGVTWATQKDLILTTYARISDNGTDRIDIIASEHPNDTDRHEHSIWHGYVTGGNFYQTDGTLIGAIGSGPYATSTMTKVYDGATTYGWVWDVMYDASSGHPYCVFVTFPGNDGSSHLYQWARWTGSAWSVHQVVDGGSYMPASTIGGEAFYSGGITIDHADPNTVYYATKISGQWEVSKAVTANNGTTFTATQITTTSAGKQVRPIPVRSADDLKALWMAGGSYADYFTYSVGTSAYKP